VQAHVDLAPAEAENNMRPHTWDELRAEVREAEEQIARGEVCSDEEDNRMFDECLSEKD